jgi:hypothetical protein
MKSVKSSENEPTAPTGIFALQKFCGDSGISAVTAWRWREEGWLETVNISGRVYVTSEALARFKKRAAAGEFAKDHKVPRKVHSVLP